MIEHRTTIGPTISVGAARATLESQVLSVRLPFGAVVWNRPSSVVVERGHRLLIVDVTRLAQAALWACALAVLVASRRWPNSPRGALK